ncbi:MAG TPA: DUF3352 domain-containing protein [Solirubrobacteraceae bacterium]|nr:DUF3352 domain-containing protein [Solirubrobacteraceae bacterium]
MRSVQTQLVRLRTIALLLTASAVAIGGCGSSGSSSTGNANPASIVPASAAFYASAVTNPSGKLKADELAAAQKLTHQTDPIGSLIGELQSASGTSINFKRDIQPWLGDRAGVFISSIDLSSASSDLLGGGLTKLLSKDLFESSSDGSGADAVQGALVLDASDLGKARSFLDDQAHKENAHATSYKGVAYKVNTKSLASGIVGDFAVVGSEAGVKSVIDTSKGGASIASAPNYTKLSASAETGAIANAYLSLDTLLGQTKGSDNSASLVNLLRKVLGGAGQAYLSVVPTPNRIAVDIDTLPGTSSASTSASSSASTSTSTSTSTGTSTAKASSGSSGSGKSSDGAHATSAQVLGQLPGDAWLALGIGNVDRTLGTGAAGLRALVSLGSQLSIGPISLKGALTPLVSKDVIHHDLSWIDSAAIFAGGSGLLNLQAGVVIGAKSSEGPRAAVSVLSNAYRKAGGTVSPVVIPGADTAVMARVQGLPLVLDIAAGNNKLVLGLGPTSVTEALNPSSTLASSAAYSSATGALGHGIEPSLLVDLPTVVGLLDTLGLNNQPTIATLFPYLQAITALTAGGVQDLGNGVKRARVVVGLQQTQ